MSEIRLHKNFGLAPVMPICYVCGKEKGEIALLGAAWKGKEEPPMHMVLDKTPCEECQGWMKQGIILISVRDGEKGEEPYRTGKWVVVKREAAEKVFTEDILKSRMAFVEDSVWEKIGLPARE